MNILTDVSEVPIASTLYFQNRAIKLLRNVPPTVHSATTRKTVLVMTHAIQTANLTSDPSACVTNVVTTVAANSNSWS